MSFMNTSGETDLVWVHNMPYTKYSVFPTLIQTLTTDTWSSNANTALRARLGEITRMLGID